jgi:Dolichyl-phosphate-mannose-protein mannosyltransferase
VIKAAPDHSVGDLHRAVEGISVHKRSLTLPPMRLAVDSVNRTTVLVCLTLVLLIGMFFRLPPSLFSTKSAPLHSLAILHPSPKWHDLGLVGVDEGLYRDYVEQLSDKGLSRYPDIVAKYIEKQAQLPGAVLPPLRFLYIFAGYVWHALFHSDALASLKNAASLFSILTLGLAALLAWRMCGPAWSVAVTALVSFAPTQIHMSQHALIDGFFAFWALLTLWLLWESLQSPRQWRWVAAYTVTLALLVLTKESAFFVWVAIIVVLATNRWLRFGRISSELVIATIIGPMLGIIALIILAGGINVLIQTYQLFVTKNYTLPYQVRTGDGPWQRYLVDLLLVSPVILILAIGALFRINRTKPAELFMMMFIAGSYAAMCNVKYGMNLRFANMWDVPLRFLAFGTLASVVAPLRQRRYLVLAAVIAIICALEIRQYQILFVEHSLHELASEGLLRVLNIVK